MEKRESIKILEGGFLTVIQNPDNCRKFGIMLKSNYLGHCTVSGGRVNELFPKCGSKAIDNPTYCNLVALKGSINALLIADKNVP